MDRLLPPPSVIVCKDYTAAPGGAVPLIPPHRSWPRSAPTSVKWHRPASLDDPWSPP